MAAGRKPIPTNIRKLRGNPGKRAYNTREPAPPPMKLSCPSELKGEARKEWFRITKLLSQYRIVTALDRTALIAYCVMYERFVDAQDKVREVGVLVKTPNGYPVANPYYAVLTSSLKQLHAMLVEFGMTPASRSRIEVTEGGEEAGKGKGRFFAS